MSDQPLSLAIRDWQAAIGDQFVVVGDGIAQGYSNNVSQFTKEIPAVLKPASADEVQKIVAIANRYKIPVYPISCGKNWGLGSCLPVQDGNVIVDLRRMNRIHEVNIHYGYAVIEPGVTQEQLYLHLKENNLPLLMNVTGSGLQSSVIGNALERGIGYFSSRADTLSGIEVVLGNGDIVTSGFGHYPNSQVRYSSRHGIGPGLDGLFYQSNYGIVTSAGISLMPKKAAHITMIASLEAEVNLPHLVDKLAKLTRHGLIQSITHIGNRNRTEITLCPLIFENLRSQDPDKSNEEILSETKRIFELGGFTSWSAVAGIQGTKGYLKNIRRDICQALRGIAKVKFIDDSALSLAQTLTKLSSILPSSKRHKALLYAIKPLYELSKGIPTDAALKSVYWPIEGPDGLQSQDPDQSSSGLLYCLPFVPLSGSVAQSVISRTETVLKTFEFIPYVTLNIIDSKVLECVISIAFDRRNPERIQAAHECISQLEDDLIAEGHFPYRVGIQSMPKVVSGGDTFWQTVRALKNVLDPNNIIAPGRYNLK